MKLTESLLPEFNQEMAATRKALERVPDDKWEWKPHPKSMTMRQLTVHLAQLPMWASTTMQQESFDLAPSGGADYRPPSISSRKDLLDFFDKNLAEARTAISSASDEHLGKPWTLLSGGRTLFTLPRVAVLRSFVMNHNIHHRAQLGVYLRLNDIAVPGPYGPSADEKES